MTQRRSRSDIIQILLSTQPWAEVLVDAMDSVTRERYLSRKKALDLYIAGETIESIHKLTSVNAKDIHRLIKRCTRLSPNGIAFGYRGLIPNLAISGYVRSAPVKSQLPEVKSGYAGALTQLFSQYPGLQTFLDDKILKKGKRHNIQEHAIKAQALHRHFIDYLKRLKHPQDAWPFNTTYQGYRSIATYLNDRIGMNFDAAISVRGSEHAKAHLSVGNGKDPILNLNQVLSAVEIDSHKIDANFVIGVQNPEGLISYVPLKRINILALVDRSSTAVLWYLVVYSSEVSATDVVRLITESLREVLPIPENNLLGLIMPADGGFPAEKIIEMRHALPSVLMPDNALSNLAGAVSQELRKELGFSICYGAPGHFEIRPNVERTFRNIAQAIFQRFPSTTGSKPTDGRKSVEIAIKLEMESDALEEMVHYHFGRHNSLKTEGLSFLSPLEYLRQKLSADEGHIINRILPAHKINSITHYRLIRKVKVRCYKEKGVRPFINFDRVRYSNDVLRNSVWLKNKEILIHIDEQDLRVVYAYFPDGSVIGPLRAAGLWGITRHSRKTRQSINKLRSQRLLQLLESEDPVIRYLEYQAQLIAASKAGKKSAAASELKRVRAEVEKGSSASVVATTSVLDDKVKLIESAKETVDVIEPLQMLIPTLMPDLKKILNRS